MKTLIELYVNEQFDDLLAAMTLNPKRTVFLTTGCVPEKTARESAARFIRDRNVARFGEKAIAEVEFINIGSRSADKLFEKLDEIFNKYPDAAIEMTGGSTAALIAAQRYCEEKRVKSFFFDSRKGRFRSIYGMEGELRDLKLPAIDVDTLILMGGGKVIGTKHSTSHLDENMDCVRSMLDIYSKYLGEWNSLVEYLQFACKHYYDSTTQLFSAPSALINNSNLFIANKKLLNLLSEAGAINELAMDAENIVFRFANGFIREILTTVGMCLELFIYVAAVDSGEFDSARMSVELDWDGAFRGGAGDTTNEIDVIMTRGVESRFVSCKTARPDTRDLYEIGYLADKFGGRNAVAVLATAIDLSGESWSNYLRARDMGVIVIERADIMKGMEHTAKLLVSPEWLEEKPKK
ncbi:MAG: DUF1887 family protein [Clostridia bacterium]|nr:DUF1887 family protein [Clostridia bacterium]